MSKVIWAYTNNIFLDFSLLARKKNTPQQYRFNDTLDSNGDDEHLVEGQVQGGVEDDDILVIPILEEENILIDVLCEGDKSNENFFNFYFNVSDLY